MAKRSYKTIFKDLTWSTVQLSKFPYTKKVYIDGDSMVYSYMREFMDKCYDKTMNEKIIGARIHGIDIMTQYILYQIAKFACIMLTNMISRLDKYNYEWVLVFGRGHIDEKSTLYKERQNDREIIYKKLKGLFPKKLCIHPGLIAIKIDIRTCIITYSMSFRDEIRDKVKIMISSDKGHEKKYNYVEDEEPDMYSPRQCPYIITEDFDNILFGAKIILKPICQDDFKYVTIDDILKTLSINDLETLIKMSVLCGTDYNIGINGIGPVKSKKSILNNSYADIIDTKVVELFMQNNAKILWKEIV